MTTPAEQIDAIAAAHVHRERDRAVRYLRVLDTVDQGTQGELVARILCSNGILPSDTLKHICYDKDAPSEKTWQQYAQRHGKRVGGWVDRALCRNHSLISTALDLWAKISHYTGEERTATFTLLLKSPLIPYAPLPAFEGKRIPREELHRILLNKRHLAGFVRRAFLAKDFAESAAMLLSLLVDNWNDPKSRLAIISFLLQEAKTANCESTEVNIDLGPLVEILAQQGK
ncbi:MAG: hypothetical protein WD200_02135 [Candidatus Andersenbacteria bacterium]